MSCSVYSTCCIPLRLLSVLEILSANAALTRWKKRGTYKLMFVFLHTFEFLQKTLWIGWHKVILQIYAVMIHEFLYSTESFCEDVLEFAFDISSTSGSAGLCWQNMVPLPYSDSRISLFILYVTARLFFSYWLFSIFS